MESLITPYKSKYNITMAKEIIKIAGQMILYILILVALVFVFYPEHPKERTNSPAQTTQFSVTKN